MGSRKLWSPQGHVQGTSHLPSDLKEELEWARSWRVKLSEVCLSHRDDLGTK